MNKKQAKNVYNGLLIVIITFIVVNAIINIALETADILKDVPHIMDTPSDDSYSLNDSLYKTSLNDSI